METNEGRPKVGYWWSDKKNLRMNADDLAAVFSAKGYNLVKLNLNEPLDKQGPFEAIVHKLSDMMVKADKGDQSAQKIVSDFENYIASNPGMIVFDPMDKVRILMDRYRQYKLVDDSALSSEIGLFTPTFVELNSKNFEENVEKLKAAGVKYPFVCKPTVAHGSTLAHHMSLIFSEDGLNDITPPCVAQTFINHNARLFKLFVIKNDYYIIERPSLKNFIAGNFPTIHFCSHDISKPKSCSSLSELDESDLQSMSTTEPDKSRLNKIVEVITDKLGLSLYGIDVIIENGTGRYAIIDMNAFPGYEGVDNILELLRDMIVEEIDKQNAAGQKCIKKCNCEIKAKCEAEAATVSSQETEKVKDEAKKSETHNDIDSGIETSDSCDEQKNKAICIKSMRRQHSKNCANAST